MFLSFLVHLTLDSFETTVLERSIERHCILSISWELYYLFWFLHLPTFTGSLNFAYFELDYFWSLWTSISDLILEVHHESSKKHRRVLRCIPSKKLIHPLLVWKQRVFFDCDKTSSNLKMTVNDLWTTILLNLVKDGLAVLSWERDQVWSCPFNARLSFKEWFRSRDDSGNQVKTQSLCLLTWQWLWEEGMTEGRLAIGKSHGNYYIWYTDSILGSINRRFTCYLPCLTIVFVSQYRLCLVCVLFPVLFRQTSLVKNDI